MAPKTRPGSLGPRGLQRRGGTYDFTGQNVTLLKRYPKSIFLDSESMFFGFSAPKNTKTFSKGSFTRFLQKNGPGRGGVLPDFTRCGTNYLHTTLLKTYQRSNLLDCVSMFFGFSAPMQCLFEGHQTVEQCPCFGTVVVCGAPRQFVAVFRVKSHQECQCIRAECTHKRYISSRQCDIEALNMVQCVFHHGAITICRPLIVLLVHTTPYAS